MNNVYPPVDMNRRRKRVLAIINAVDGILDAKRKTSISLTYHRLSYYAKIVPMNKEDPVNTVHKESELFSIIHVP